MLPIKVSNYYNWNRQKVVSKATLSYVEDILICLSYRFGELIGDGMEVDEKSLMGDKLLHDVCALVDTRNWVLPEDTTANLDNAQLICKKYLRVPTESMTGMNHCCLKSNLKLPKIK